MCTNGKTMAKIAVNKSLVKEYMTGNANRTVYLDNGTEFQIQIFNPETAVCGADIYVNGEQIGNRLVIRPGERIWLERYINTAVKFKFSTYTVESGSEEVDKAIRDNGNVEIRFYKYRKDTFNSSNVSSMLWKKDYPGFKPLNDNMGIVYPDMDVVTTNIIYSAPTVGGIAENFKIQYNSTQPDVSVLNCATTDTAMFSQPLWSTTTTMSVNDTKETGRIEKGGNSSQIFEYTDDFTFETAPCHVEHIKILPMSCKTVSANDLQKLYCTECGRKINPKFKFCPYCGQKVE